MIPTVVDDQLQVFQSRFESMRTNSGLLSTPDGGVVLIDPGLLPEDIAAIKQAMGTRPLHLVVNTHFHIDHILGLSAFPDARRLASPLYAQYLDRIPRDQAYIAEYSQKHQVEWQPPFAYLPPNRVINGRGPLHEALPGWEAIPAPGHSNDLLALYDSHTRTLWASDAVSDLKTVPILVDGAITPYLETLDRLEALDVETLIPGHGKVAEGAAQVQAYIDSYRAYLRALESRILPILEAGGTLDEATAACQEIRLPSRYFEGSHRFNVKQAWVGFGGPPPEKNTHEDE